MIKNNDLKISNLELSNLFMLASGKSITLCLADMSREFSFSEYALISRWLKLIKNKVPLPYVTGYKEFFSRNFWVNQNVLIPRPESELLVEIAVDSILLMQKRAQKREIKVLELGTGSGAVIISIVLELLKHGVSINAHASDVCSKALSVAKNNSSWLGAEISYSQSNWFKNFQMSKKKFDLIICNPPYIGLDHEKYICKNELLLEPKLALYGLNPTADGTSNYQEIISQVRNWTETGSLLIMEHGSMQRKKINKILYENRLESFEEINDFSGLPRVVKVRL